MPECVECDEVITQPICPVCLARGVASWLQEKLPEKPELLLQLQDLTDDAQAPSDEAQCVICNGRMSCCSACYTQRIHAWMHRSHPLLSTEFMAIFSLDPQFAHIEQDAARVTRVQVYS